MDPYDTAATRAVWDRVLRTQEKPEEATIEDVLRARIAAEKTNRLTYLALARCAGPYAGTLRAIAAQEGQHAQTRRSALCEKIPGCKCSRGSFYPMPGISRIAVPK